MTTQSDDKLEVPIATQDKYPDAFSQECSIIDGKPSKIRVVFTNTHEFFALCPDDAGQRTYMEDLIRDSIRVAASKPVYDAIEHLLLPYSKDGKIELAAYFVQFFWERAEDAEPGSYYTNICWRIQQHTVAGLYSLLESTTETTPQLKHLLLTVSYIRAIETFLKAVEKQVIIEAEKQLLEDHMTACLESQSIALDALKDMGITRINQLLVAEEREKLMPPAKPKQQEAAWVTKSNNN